MYTFDSSKPLQNHQFYESRIYRSIGIEYKGPRSKEFIPGLEQFSLDEITRKLVQTTNR